jgi:hypothetical protein
VRNVFRKVKVKWPQLIGDKDIQKIHTRTHKTIT